MSWWQLLYLSPERLVKDDVLEWLKRVPVGFFAIDEAHCISEWGHEFRPEYRKLRALRDWFPEVPIAAFTASATRPVRHDIVAQLGLHDPAKIAMSFHRPNLRYIVHECAAREQDGRVQAALDWYSEGNVIVYAPTIKSVEATAVALERQGLQVVPYHGQMDNNIRRRNQEAWMTGEKRVLVGTLAFGLGINKPDVRAVIHLALPKSLEQYYQEAGRAGRDGLPADCILLWQKRDASLLVHFIQQLQNEAEKSRALAAVSRDAQVRRSCNECRHRADSVLYFRRDPEVGAVRCVRYLRGEAGVVGRSARSQRAASPLAAAESLKVHRTKLVESLPGDPALRDKLKEWRRGLAKDLSVPAYVILHDSTIDALCRQMPSTILELMDVQGIGEKKAERFGAAILGVIRG